MKKKILTLSLSLVVLSVSQLHAGMQYDGYVNAYSDLAWNNLVVTGGLTPYTFYHSRSMARTADVWDITTQASWVNDSKYNSQVTFARSSFPLVEYTAALAEGETAASFISSESSVMLMPGSFGAYSAEARSMQGQSYSVASTGTVTFTVPYFLDIEMGDTDDNNGEYAYARAWSWLRLYNWDTHVWDLISGTYTEVTTEGSGTLSISYAATAGSYILFEAGADTRVALVNPVPVPPSVLMLLTGCSSLFFLRRRQS